MTIGVFRHADGRRAVLLNNYRFAGTAGLRLSSTPAEQVIEADRHTKWPRHRRQPDMDAQVSFGRATDARLAALVKELRSAPLTIRVRGGRDGAGRLQASGFPGAAVPCRRPVCLRRRYGSSRGRLTVRRAQAPRLEPRQRQINLPSLRKVRAAQAQCRQSPAVRQHGFQLSAPLPTCPAA